MNIRGLPWLARLSLLDADTHQTISVPLLPHGRNGELLDPAAGGRLSHIEVAVGVDAHPMGTEELAHLAATPAELANDF